MASLHFFLRKDKVTGDGTMPVNLRYSHGESTPAKFSPGIRLKESEWDENKQRIRAHPNKDILNKVLSDYYSKIQGYQFLLGGEPMPQDLKQYAAEQDNPTDKSFKAVWKRFIEYGQSLKSKDIITSYNVTYNHLLRFNPNISWQDFDPLFGDDFSIYLMKEAEQTNNTIGTNIRNMKTFFSWGEGKFHNNSCYKKWKRLSAPTKDNHISLTEKELITILNLNLRTRLQQNARDCIIVGCLTSFRHKDIRNLKPVNLKDNILDIQTNKTKTSIYIPLLPVVIDIFNRWKTDQKLMKLYSHQKINEAIKAIAYMAGLHEIKELVFWRGSERIVVEKPRWQLVSTHTARRTFLTLMRRNGMSREVRASFSGHAGTTMDIYDEITIDDKRECLERAWESIRAKALGV